MQFFVYRTVHALSETILQAHKEASEIAGQVGFQSFHRCLRAPIAMVSAEAKAQMQSDDLFFFNRLHTCAL